MVPLHEPFETALRGFNRQQVLAHIESLEGHISMVTADRESALEQVAEASRTIGHLRQESELLTHLRQETQRVNEQIEHMAQEPIVGASVRIQRIVRLAEEEATELKAQAEKEIEELRARADEEVSAQRERATNDAEALLRDTTQRCKQLETDSEQRRHAAEQSAEQGIARREAEANARLQRQEQHSLAALHVMLALINRHLTQRSAEVESQEAALAELRAQVGAEVAALEASRSAITTQLAATRQTLAEILEEVQQTKIQDNRVGPTVPAPREGHPNGENSAQSGAVHLVNPRPDPRLREDRA